MSDSIHSRLGTQLEALDVVLAGAPSALVDRRPASGDWSARENLAHLARHATVFLERLDTIVRDDRPRLGRYRAEEDPEWPQWAGLPLDDVLSRLKEARRDLIAWVRALSADQTRRVGLHPSFGPMTIPQLLEFFLLHEAHHLYTAMLRIADARRATAPASGTQEPA